MAAPAGAVRVTPSFAEGAHEIKLVPGTMTQFIRHGGAGLHTEPSRVAQATNDYQLDDGTVDDAIGTNTAGTIISTYVQYNIIGGAEILTTVNVEAGFGAGDCDGLAVTVAVLDDPNGDGDPADGVVIELGTGVLTTTGDNITDKIALDNDVDLDAALTNLNESFFIAFQLTQTAACGFPAAVDQTAPVPGRTYLGIGGIPTVDCAIENCCPGCAGNALVRANSTPPVCGDGTCVPIVEQCTCPADCTPDANESGSCTDGIDNDCDMDVDCDDSDCVADLACIPCDLDDVGGCPGGPEGGDAGACPGGSAGAETVCADGNGPDAYNSGCNSNSGFVWGCGLPYPAGAATNEVCGTIGRYRETCVSDADCPLDSDEVTNEPCVGGLCRSECTMDADCNADALPGPETCDGSRCTGEWTPVRDTDWLQFTVPAGQSQSLTLCATAEVDALIGIVDDAGGGNCAAAAFIVATTTTECEEGCVDLCAVPGTYTAFIAPSAGALNAPCGSEYTLSLTNNNSPNCEDGLSACDPAVEGEGDLACQEPNQGGNGLPPDDNLIGLTSTDTLSVADTFTALSPGNIDHACWWGTWVDFGGTTGPCAEADIPAGNFDITYYEDSPGLPGAVLAQFLSVTSSDVVTGLTVGSGVGTLIETSHSANHAEVDIASGPCYWVEIKQNNPSEDDCAWLWSTAPPGDSISAQDAAGDGYQANERLMVDVAWCLGDLVGDQSFLNQPGGCFFGSACCHSDGSCDNVEDVSECQAAGDNFLEGTLCGLAVCNAADSCVFDNGPGDPGGGAPASQLALTDPVDLANDFYAEAADDFELKGTAGDCTVSTITWYSTHFNIQAGCTEPDCTNTPADYSSIRVTIYNDNGDPKGPSGQPFHETVGLACGIDQECVDGGCGDGATCGGDSFCDIAGGDPCEFIIPDGSHTGIVKHELTITDFSWIPYEKNGEPVEDAFQITLNIPNIDVEKNKKNWLAIAPQVPFADFYQTAWMTSQNSNGNSGQQIFEALDLPWTAVDADLGFNIGGGTPPGCMGDDPAGCPTDACTWCECVADVCNCISKGTQADLGGGNGACPVDGACDGNDRFHALNCFSNVDTLGTGLYPCETAPPAAVNIDAGGPGISCPRDGVCDGNDAFHALNCFSNINSLGMPPYPCGCPGPGPAPDAPSDEALVVTKLTTGVTVRGPRTVRPGDLVSVDVYMDDAIKSVRGYQLHLGVSGGTHGQWELVDISVDDRSNYAFIDGPATWSAFNVERGQMVVGMDQTEGTPTSAGAYLATYTYRVPKDASGAFTVEVLYDDSTLNPEHRTFLFTDYAQLIDVDGVSPARISVVANRSR